MAKELIDTFYYLLFQYYPLTTLYQALAQRLVLATHVPPDYIHHGQFKNEIDPGVESE